jgi:hypothetical protein
MKSQWLKLTWPLKDIYYLYTLDYQNEYYMYVNAQLNSITYFLSEATYEGIGVWFPYDWKYPNTFVLNIELCPCLKN